MDGFSSLLAGRRGDVSLVRLVIVACALASIALLPSPVGAGPPAVKGLLKSDVPIEHLVQFNSRALFGSGKVTVVEGRVEILIARDGDLPSAFKGKGVMDSTHPTMKGANRRFIQYGDQKDGEKLLPGLAGIGYGRGVWVSRFPLAGETKVSFEIRVPNILTRESDLRVRINSKNRAALETSFFNSLSKVSNGIVRGTVLTSLEKYQGPASKWFPRKGEPIPVEFAVSGGRCSIRFGGEETVAIDGVDDGGGEVAFLFNKALFTLQNLRISGKLDLDWCEKELARLEKKGKLLEEPPVPEDGEPPPDAEAAEKRKKEAEEDL